ncbi:hypothetical protein GL218_08724 [Daldinia childiae]|uniref:uncharacterized protein n=1 Tax=Daldinia childiae TaxID=326645 RepID=UPI0014478B69|nr:uncharacterized protein GL218_08724 [Daldinia childiae]KAF3067297.1 hypothetical protein GL218_08724 [Daldinia childiae]
MWLMAETSAQREEQAHQQYKSTRADVQRVICSALPNLEVIVWHLSIHLKPDFELRDILANCGTFSHLETLVIQPLPEFKEYAEFIAGFIARHETVKKLYVSEDAHAHDSTAHLDACVIPLFSTGRFEHLRTLSLTWGGPDYHTVSIPVASLTAIACLASLEELSLGVGTKSGVYCRWLVDHDQLRDVFFKLKKLKGLALQHDTYPWEILSSSENSDRFYGTQSFTDDEMSDMLARPDLDETPGDLTRLWNRKSPERGVLLWEVLHRNRMLTLTEAWAAAFPNLEWTYFGQWFMGVKEELGDPTRKKVVPLTETRDEHCRCQFLVDTFTIAGFEK